MGRSQSHRHHRHQTAATVVAQRQQLTPRYPRSSTHSAPCSTTAKPSSTARSSNSDPTVRQNSRRDTASPACTVINTEHWTDYPVIRTFDEPRAVKVDIGRALPLGRGGASRADHVSMRVKTSALYMSGYLDGILKFWAIMHDGQWLAGIPCESPMPAEPSRRDRHARDR